MKLLITITGPFRSGKSTIARDLAALIRATLGREVTIHDHPEPDAPGRGLCLDIPVEIHVGEAFPPTSLTSPPLLHIITHLEDPDLFDWEYGTDHSGTVRFRPGERDAPVIQWHGTPPDNCEDIEAKVIDACLG